VVSDFPITRITRKTSISVFPRTQKYLQHRESIYNYLKVLAELDKCFSNFSPLIAPSSITFDHSILKLFDHKYQEKPE